MIKSKRGSAWIWIVIILILIGIGVGIYFWLSGDAGSIVNAGTNAGNSILRPPALPPE